jgi:predicted RecB family nuclease
MPRKVRFAHRSGSEWVRMDDIEGDVVDLITKWNAIRLGTFQPDLPAFQDACSPWDVYAKKLLQQRRDITAIAGFTARVREKISQKLRVSTLDGLRNLTLEHYERVFPAESAFRHYWQARSYLSGTPIVLPGRSLSIPSRRRNYVLDFETVDQVISPGSPHAYLIGLLMDGDCYRSFVARGPENEGRSFREFIDVIGDPKEVCLYTWTGYEAKVLEQVSARHPSLASRLAAIAESCIDLHRIVKDSVVLPVGSYGLKTVAPTITRFRWRQEDVNGLDSQCLWEDWIHGDAAALQKLLIYNEDDVTALRHVLEVLQVVEAANLQRRPSMKFMPPPPGNYLDW